MTQKYLRQAYWAALVGAMALAPTGSAAGHHGRRPNVGPLAAVKTFIANFRRQSAEARADITTVDEVPLQAWQGQGAFQAWANALRLSSDAAGGPPVILHGSPQADRDMAYAIAPVLYSYQTHGAVVVEPARMAISLRRGAAGWKVTGWAWAGANPQTFEQTASMSRFLPAG